MYGHYDNIDYAFVGFFSLILLMVGCLFGMIVSAAEESGQKSLNVTGVISTLIVAAITGGVASLMQKSPLFMAMPAAFFIGFLIVAICIMRGMAKEIKDKLRLSAEVTALGDKLMAFLDNDQDGVISAADIRAAGDKAQRQGITAEVVNFVKNNMSFIGHEIDGSVRAISPQDIHSLETRAKEKWKEWLE